MSTDKDIAEGLGIPPEQLRAEMDAVSLNSPRLRGLAILFRSKHGFPKDGYVVFWRGEACGWMSSIEGPQAWRPGCVAISFDDSERPLVATGGNYKTGSDRWEVSR